MQRLPTSLDGLVLLEPTVHGDARGFFMETFRADVALQHGVPTEYLQDNHSRSRRGTLHQCAGRLCTILRPSGSHSPA